MPGEANKRQVGGTHYNKFGDFQHWDMAWHFKLDAFQYQITKYVMRWKDKNGIQDLEKARHFLDKYIELVKKDAESPIGPDVTVTDGAGGGSGGTMEVRVISVGDARGGAGGESKYMPDRKPTGWVGFTYEGGDAVGDMFRCTTCKAHFKIAVGGNPNIEHKCGSDPTRAYVDQG